MKIRAVINKDFCYRYMEAIYHKISVYRQGTNSLNVTYEETRQSAVFVIVKNPLVISSYLRDIYTNDPLTLFTYAINCNKYYLI